MTLVSNLKEVMMKTKCAVLMLVVFVALFGGYAVVLADGETKLKDDHVTMKEDETLVLDFLANDTIVGMMSVSVDTPPGLVISQPSPGMFQVEKPSAGRYEIPYQVMTYDGEFTANIYLVVVPTGVDIALLVSDNEVKVGDTVTLTVIITNVSEVSQTVQATVVVSDVTPTPTPVPTETPTPDPTESPDPTETPDPGTTPDPTETPEPGVTPNPTPGTQLVDDYITMTEGDSKEFDFIQNDTLNGMLSVSVEPPPGLVVSQPSPGIFRVEHPAAGQYQIIYRIVAYDGEFTATIYLTVQPAVVASSNTTPSSFDLAPGESTSWNYQVVIEKDTCIEFTISWGDKERTESVIVTLIREEIFLPLLRSGG